MATCWWTRDQVEKLQNFLGVPITGILNRPTWDAIVAHLGLTEKSEPIVTKDSYYVRDHWLYSKNGIVNIKKSPNCGGIIEPELIVIHYTGDNNLHGALSWLCNPAAKVSAHLVIAKTGQIWQLVPFNRAAWHAGKSEYDGRPNVNSFSIGIENVGIGDEWPEPQIKANIEVIKALCAAYDIKALAGHEEVAVPAGRKSDPGPKYPWDLVLKEVGFTEV